MKWRIWSFEHDAWWMPAANGYTDRMSEAGLYEFEEALTLVREANKFSDDGKVNEAMVPHETKNV